MPQPGVSGCATVAGPCARMLRNGGTLWAVHVCTPCEWDGYLHVLWQRYLQVPNVLGDTVVWSGDGRSGAGAAAAAAAGVGAAESGAGVGEQRGMQCHVQSGWAEKHRGQGIYFVPVHAASHSPSDAAAAFEMRRNCAGTSRLPSLLPSVRSPRRKEKKKREGKKKKRIRPLARPPQLREIPSLSRTPVHTDLRESRHLTGRYIYVHIHTWNRGQSPCYFCRPQVNCCPSFSLSLGLPVLLLCHHRLSSAQHHSISSTTTSASTSTSTSTTN